MALRYAKDLENWGWIYSTTKNNCRNWLPPRSVETCDPKMLISGGDMNFDSGAPEAFFWFFGT